LVPATRRSKVPLVQNGPILPSSPIFSSALVQQLVTALVASGRGDEDYSAIATVLFELGRQRPVAE
jgi:hypothetical protein